MLLAVLLLAAAPASANQIVLDQLRGHDERVGTIGYRLARNGVPLCPASVVPLAGLRVHTLGQYGKAVQGDARRLFGLGEYPAILTIAPDSPAARAGLMTGDWIVSINDADQRAGPGYAGVERFDASLEAALARPPVRIGIERAGQRQTISLAGIDGCASRVELVPGRKLNAVADGRIVQLTTGVMQEAQDDDELAFIIAHEMAHNILEHRKRLDKIGRSARNIRVVEIEADRLGLRLMKAAGYDPAAAARFWSRFGKKTGAGIFSDGTHMRTKDRVRLLRDEATSLTQ
jgi:membrane-associated protease RseP (regulator of RpoE activity)